MATPDPEGVSLLAKVIGAAAAIVVPIGGAYKWLDSRFDKKADKSEVDKQFSALNAEMTTQRGNVGKIFDQMKESDRIAEERHRELLMHLIRDKQ